MSINNRNKTLTYLIIILAVSVVLVAAWYFLDSSTELIINPAVGSEAENIVDYARSRERVLGLIGVLKGNYFDNPLFKSLKQYVTSFPEPSKEGNPNLFNPPVAATGTLRQ
jgi:hypothetical protein